MCILGVCKCPCHDDIYSDIKDLELDGATKLGLLLMHENPKLSDRDKKNTGLLLTRYSLTTRLIKRRLRKVAPHLLPRAWRGNR